MSSSVLNLDAIHGQITVKNSISKAFQTGRLAHAYLFLGPEGAGKLALALEYGKALLCKTEGAKPCRNCVSCKQAREVGHPSLALVFPKPKTAKRTDIDLVRASIAEQPYLMRRPWPNPSISISEIRELRRQLGLKSYQGESRIIIVADAHKMTVEATNALLKILEEPPANTYFVLTSSSPEELLPTILSRCQHLNFGVLQTEAIEKIIQSAPEIDSERAKLIARLACGNIRRAFSLLDEKQFALRQDAVELMRAAFMAPAKYAVFCTQLAQKRDKTLVREILQNALIWTRDAMTASAVGPEKSQEMIVNIDQTETIEKFVQGFPKFDYKQAVHQLELSMYMLQRYVQPALVLLVLVKKIRQCAKQS